MRLIENESSDIWKVWCHCSIWRWDIEKTSTTWSNYILAIKVRNYNSMVLNRDNTKLKKYK